MTMAMLLALGASAQAREVTQEVPAKAPEAWYLLPRGPYGGQRQIQCNAEAVVGPDGRAQDARAVGCSPILGEAIEAALMRWRWAPSSQATAEQVRVTVRAPSLVPRSRRSECLVGLQIRGDRPTWMAEVPKRCAIGLTEVPARPPAPPTPTAWCAVDVRVRDGAIQEMSAEDCAEAYRGVAQQAVRSWTLSTDKDQQWRILLGYEPQGTERVDFGSRTPTVDGPVILIEG